MNTNWTLAKDLLIRSLSAKAGNRKDEEEILITCGLAQLKLANSKTGKENLIGKMSFKIRFFYLASRYVIPLLFEMLICTCAKTSMCQISLCQNVPLL